MCYEEIVSWARDGLAGVECLLSEIDDILQYLSTFDSGGEDELSAGCVPSRGGSYRSRIRRADGYRTSPR